MIEPMTLGNMRANGVHSLAVYCERCHHQELLDVNDFADDVLVPVIRLAHGLHSLWCYWCQR